MGGVVVLLSVVEQGPRSRHCSNRCEFGIVVVVVVDVMLQLLPVLHCACSATYVLARYERYRCWKILNELYVRTNKNTICVRIRTYIHSSHFTDYTGCKRPSNILTVRQPYVVSATGCCGNKRLYMAGCGYCSIRGKRQ